MINDAREIFRAFFIVPINNSYYQPISLQDQKQAAFLRL